MEKMIRNNKGQSAVEYILLLAVIVILVVGVIRSPYFQSIFGPQSQMFRGLAKYLEFSYRHTHLNLELDPLDNYDNYSGSHQSYVHPGGGDTRFFLVSVPYGEE